MTQEEREQIVAQALNTPEGQKIFEETFNNGFVEAFDAVFGNDIQRIWNERIETGYYELPFRWWQYDSPQDAFVAEMRELIRAILGY